MAKRIRSTGGGSERSAGSIVSAHCERDGHIIDGSGIINYSSRPSSLSLSAQQDISCAGAACKSPKGQAQEAARIRRVVHVLVEAA